jgi:nucleotide-binding universal stress UspA family protein
MRIRTVLCPIDFSILDELELGIATEVCRAFDATLVLHHNLAAADPGFSRAWEWAKAHGEHRDEVPDAERRLQALVNEVAHSVRAQGTMTSGPIAQVVLALARGLDVDLIVLGSHGWSTQDHASVTERLIAESPCPVLTFQEGVSDATTFRLSGEAGTAPLPVLVPTDLTRGSSAAVAYACALARELPLRLDLLHVVTVDPSDATVAHAQVGIDSHVPPDLVGRVVGHVRVGPAAETIAEYADETAPAFVVLGEHARGFVRRLLTRDTTRDVMHSLRCPVWVVPPQATA